MENKLKHAGGRPAKFKTPQELELAIDKYFKDGAYKRKVITQLGVEVEIPTPTITDLVLYLGFADRHSFYAYEEKPEFSNTIKRARSMIEREYEMCLRGSTPTGAIFALKNFGWIDKHEIDHKINLTLSDQIKEARGRIVQPKVSLN